MTDSFPVITCTSNSRPSRPNPAITPAPSQRGGSRMHGSFPLWAGDKKGKSQGVIGSFAAFPLESGGFSGFPMCRSLGFEGEVLVHLPRPPGSDQGSRAAAHSRRAGCTGWRWALRDPRDSSGPAQGAAPHPGVIGVARPTRFMEPSPEVTLLPCLAPLSSASGVCAPHKNSYSPFCPFSARQESKS